MASRSINLMLVAAHPADAFDTAGGTLAHHVAQGDKVTVVLATTGVRSHHWGLIEERRKSGKDFDVEARVKEAVEEKLEEVRGACRILGFDDVRDLGFEDDDILVAQDKIDAIAAMICDVKPDLIIAHHPYESGGLKMHATIGQATLYAWQLAMGVGRDKQARHLVPTLYFMNPMAYMGNNSLEYAGTSRTDICIDITDVIDKKVQALDFVASQFYAGPYARKRAETEDGSYGQGSGVAYAEQFQRFQPPVRYTLPVTDAELDLIDTPNDAIMARRGEIIGGLMPLPANTSFTAQHRVPKERYEE